MGINLLLEEMEQSIQDLGYGSYSIVNSCLSLGAGNSNNRYSLENAKQETEFQKKLIMIKEQYEDFKEAEDMAFKIWLRQKQRENRRSAKLYQLDKELSKTELQMFFKSWPLKVGIGTINEKRIELANQTMVAPMNIVIGRHNVGPAKDFFSKSYPMLVDEIKSSLEKMGVKNIYRFKDEVEVNGGGALANIFAMMIGIPTIVVLPYFYGKNSQYSITVGCWNVDSLFPMQRRIFTLTLDPVRINIDEKYKRQINDEMRHAYVTISSVLNDIYILIEEGISPFYPTYAKEYSINEKYSYLVDFAIKEYKSLINEVKSLEYLYGVSKSKMIVNKLFEAINNLK